MLYQLSYASPAQTLRKYHTGNEIASGFLKGQQNPCHTSTYSLFPCAPDVLLCSRLRELRVVQAHIVVDFGHLDGEFDLRR
jgi:hypothetical protein